MTWTALHEEEPDFKAVLEGAAIFGHKTWTLFNDTKVSILKAQALCLTVTRYCTS